MCDLMCCRLYCLEYLVTHGDGVITVVAEVATNRMAPVLSSSEPAERHSKLYHLWPKKKNYFRYKVKN